MISSRQARNQGNQPMRSSRSSPDSKNTNHPCQNTNLVWTPPINGGPEKTLYSENALMRCLDDVRKSRPTLKNARRKVETYAVNLIASRNTSTFLRSFSRNYEIKRQAISTLFMEEGLRPPLIRPRRRNTQIKKTLKTPSIF
jgi:hypothetical protein